MQGDRRRAETAQRAIDKRTHCHQPIFPAFQDAGELGVRPRSPNTPAKSRSRKCSTPRRITDRILIFDGLPNYQRLFSLRVGQTLREQFEADLAIEYEVMARLKPGIIMCREKEDATSANLLEKILADEEDHIDYLETQLQLMDKLGEQLYLAQCVSRPPTSL